MLVHLIPFNYYETIIRHSGFRRGALSCRRRRHEHIPSSALYRGYARNFCMNGCRRGEWQWQSERERGILWSRDSRSADPRSFSLSSLQHQLTDRLLNTLLLTVCPSWPSILDPPGFAIIRLVSNKLVFILYFGAPNIRPLEIMNEMCCEKYRQRCCL